MATIGFVGLGQMGGAMSRNLMRAGHQLEVFDIAEDAVAALVADGARGAASPAAVSGASARSNGSTRPACSGLTLSTAARPARNT